MGKMKKKSISNYWFLLVAICILTMCVGKDALADAADVDWNEYVDVDYDVYVTTPDGGLNMRYGPGVEYDVVIEERIPDYTILHIDMETTDTDGEYWGYTQYGDDYGWVYLNQTTLVSDYEDTEAPPEDEEYVDDSTYEDTSVVDNNNSDTNVDTFTDDEKDSDSDSNTAKIFGVTAIVVVFLIVFVVIVVVIIVAVIIIIFVIKKKD